MSLAQNLTTLVVSDCQFNSSSNCLHCLLLHGVVADRPCVQFYYWFVICCRPHSHTANSIRPSLRRFARCVPRLPSLVSSVAETMCNYIGQNLAVLITNSAIFRRVGCVMWQQSYALLLAIVRSQIFRHEVGKGNTRQGNVQLNHFCDDLCACKAIQILIRPEATYCKPFG